MGTLKRVDLISLGPYTLSSSSPVAPSDRTVVLRLSSSNCSPDRSPVVFQREPALLRILFDFFHGPLAPLLSGQRRLVKIVR